MACILKLPYEVTGSNLCFCLILAAGGWVGGGGCGVELGHVCYICHMDFCSYEHCKCARPKRVVEVREGGKGTGARGRRLEM